MKENEEGNSDYGLFDSRVYDELEREKEERFVKWMIEIIVSMILKELYQEEDYPVKRDVIEKKKKS